MKLVISRATPVSAPRRCYGGAHDDSQLQEMVLQLDDYAQSQPDPAGWLQRLPEQISNPLRREKWLQQLFAAAREQLLLARSALMQGLQIAAQPGGPEQYTDVLMQELEQIELLLDQYTQANDWDALQSAGRFLLATPAGQARRRCRTARNGQTSAQ